MKQNKTQSLQRYLHQKIIFQNKENLLHFIMMKALKLFFSMIIILIFTFNIGCSKVNGKDTQSIKAPNNDNLIIRGTWKIQDSQRAKLVGGYSPNQSGARIKRKKW